MLKEPVFLEKNKEVQLSISKTLLSFHVHNEFYCYCKERDRFNNRVKPRPVPIRELGASESLPLTSLQHILTEKDDLQTSFNSCKRTNDVIRKSSIEEIEAMDVKKQLYPNLNNSLLFSRLNDTRAIIEERRK